MLREARIFGLCIVVLGVCLPTSRGDLFTALVGLKRVLEAEHAVAHDLRHYIDREQERLDRLRHIAADFEEHSTEALADPERHLGNPVNAYLLIKRFTYDWNQILNTDIKTNATAEFLERLSSRTEYFPDQSDLTGAANALLRLQDTYALPTATIVRGDLTGVNDSPQMTADDCYLLGTIAYNSADYYHTILWVGEALNIVKTETPRTVDKASLLDYMAYSVYMQGNVQHALNLTNEWLRLEPDHIRAQNNRKYYEQIISEQMRTGQYVTGDTPLTNYRPVDTYKASQEFQTYERLCRGEKTHFSPDERLLTCQYVRHHPALYISPIKEEVIHINPRIVIFQDVLTLTDIAKVKELAEPKLDRSVVYHTTASGATTAQDYRISKSGWLRDSEDPHIARISYRAHVLANLTLDTAEEMQVLNYGIGGHYEPHYDFAQNRELSAWELYQGNRVATFLCYISDVTGGGATVFPEIGVALWPKKGNCALWYNLHRSGEGDLKTRHAACPVLSGFKWVCNKWFHERGQEFIRPCSTSPYE